jgi:hypothetical protein
MKITDIDPIVNMVLNPATHEDAAVAGFRIMHQQAARYGGLENMLSRSRTLLDRITRLDREIVVLKEKVSAAQRDLSASEKAHKSIASEQALKAQREVEQRITDAVHAMINGRSPRRAIEVPVIQRHAAPNTVTRIAASASRRKSPKLRRGEGTDNMVLSLLTNRLKCISTLFHEAQHCGFTGTENAIRFAALRLTQADNAIEGRDTRGRVAYRRAV